MMIWIIGNTQHTRELVQIPIPQGLVPQQWFNVLLVLKQTVKMVFLEVEMQGNVVVPPDQLDPKGLLLRKGIVLRLLEDIA
ncbi:hypothetical protein HPP92_028168 [Vanilla planifolia]|uniref:Uncharacterized protein n=1 Tax=Vanilla planifolia TaxID=51239 RepID=A0A835P895_VANPL|nr:hypothetical protein HPP92_028168 [Vanilla planifolia]KAG0447836.1 hypothetical protein HPP92_028146 [Vanilla planifolia]